MIPYYKPPADNEPEPDDDPPADTEGETVNEWRHARLLEAGWQDPFALLLAVDHAVDLHHACQLLEDGCDVETAWRILV